MSQKRFEEEDRTVPIEQLQLSHSAAQSPSNLPAYLFRLMGIGGKHYRVMTSCHGFFVRPVVRGREAGGTAKSHNATAR